MANDTFSMDFKTKRMEMAVDAASKLFLQHGIEEVKMTDIAAECGLGVASIYRYFGTKTGIAIAAMTHQWHEIRAMFSGIFESQVFLSKPGIIQLRDLMRSFIVLYEAHPGFMKLLAEFDLMLKRENVPKNDLADYDRSVINFYSVFESSYLTGLSDGSVREIPEFKLFYLTFAHSLMELSKKLIQGELVPSDDFSYAVNELEILINTAVYYLKKD